MSSIDEYILNMAQSEENLLDVGQDIKVWYRTWGNVSKGIPVLFVHGGPGSSTGDYKDMNEKIFDKKDFFVVEVDQRGTGNSQPSVREDYKNMKFYLDISISQMADDFEKVREKLGISKWLVFGGSWGSTLGLYYAQKFPSKCLGMIIQGIFLNTKEEIDAAYAQKSFENNPHHLKEFKTFFELGAQEARNLGEGNLDPYDSEGILRMYESMILNGNQNAIWRFFVFENNLMEEDSSKFLDPLNICEKEMPQATSYAFFETRLFLKGAFEEPLTLVQDVEKLKEGTFRTWVVQGLQDEICPDKTARTLVAKLEAEGIPHTAHFVKGGHMPTSSDVFFALQECVKDFFSKK